MSNETTVIEQPSVTTEMTETTAVGTTPAPELSYTYQPVDDLGRPLGGLQVIKYRTPDELADKLAKQNTELIRKLREVTRKHRLGIADEETIPADAPRFRGVVEFKPRDLSADERVRLSRDMSDPEKFGEASSTLFEATIGAKPEIIRQTMTDLQVTNQRLLAQIECDAFMTATPEYYKCPENAATITDWIVKNNLDPLRSNFKLAYETLKAAGLLLEAPKVRGEAVQPVNSQSAQIEPSRITTEPSAQSKPPVVPIPTGLTRNQAADTGVTRTAADEIVYDHIVKGRDGKPTGEKIRYTGLTAIQHMPSDEYGRRLRFEPGFAQKVEQLETSRARR